MWHFGKHRKIWLTLSWWKCELVQCEEVHFSDNYQNPLWSNNLLPGLQLTKILAHRQMFYWRKLLPPLPVKTLSAVGSSCPLVETMSRFHDFTGRSQILKVSDHVSHEIVSVIWKSWVTTSEFLPSPGLLHNEDIFPFSFLPLLLTPSHSINLCWAPTVC